MGTPAAGLPIALLRMAEQSRLWERLGAGVTNEDGRVGTLLPPGGYVAPGRYGLGAGFEGRGMRDEDSRSCVDGQVQSRFTS